MDDGSCLSLPTWVKFWDALTSSWPPWYWRLRDFSRPATLSWIPGGYESAERREICTQSTEKVSYDMYLLKEEGKILHVEDVGALEALLFQVNVAHAQHLGSGAVIPGVKGFIRHYQISPSRSVEFRPPDWRVLVHLEVVGDVRQVLEPLSRSQHLRSELQADFRSKEQFSKF